MDTRHKILPPAEAITVASDLRERGIPYSVVTGYFDVLQPALIEDLTNLAAEGAGLFAVVLDPPEPLMSARARTELAAALRMIDYVVHSAGEAADLIEQLDPDEWIGEEESHLLSTEHLIKHVFERHGRTFERGRKN